LDEFERISRPVPRYKRADALVDEIKQWIVIRGLKPGDRLPQESKLIELLQSSRGTVREALKVLESEGLIEIVRGANGGARIAEVSYGTASQALRNYLYFQTPSWAQVYAVREKLEPRMAAEVVDILTEADLGALRDTVEICRLGIAGKVTLRAHRVAELEFHGILARACTDPMLGFLCRFINDLLRDLALSDPREIIGPRDTQFATEAVRFHSELIDAYAARDREKVRLLMEEHVHEAGCIVAARENAFDHGPLLVPPADGDVSSRQELERHRAAHRHGSGPHDE
jgi:GntR family transcriptional regulator, transcriptional repressor for pyruvate dehydrogenase complex